MNYLDIMLLLGLGASIYFGWRRNLFDQMSASIGILLALLVIALTYGKLAFLTQGSGRRSIILLLLIGAVGFLIYDILLSLGRRLQKKMKYHPSKPSRETKLLSTTVTACTGVIIVWLAAGMLQNVPSRAIQQQIRTSRIILALEKAQPVPAIFKQVSNLLAPFAPPRVFAGEEPIFNGGSLNVGTAFDSLDSALARATTAMAKVSAWGCGSTSTGSGFFVDKKTIITNAHVIAGADRVSVEISDKSFVAQTVWFDPKLDMAVLQLAMDVVDSPLSLHQGTLANGSIAGILGYPGGRSLATGDAIILQAIDAQGYDIYNQEKTLRKIYAFRSTVQPGNSGGPLIDAEGKVVGLVFGHSTLQQRTGYAITSDQVAQGLTESRSRQLTVSNGNCATPTQ